MTNKINIAKPEPEPFLPWQLWVALVVIVVSFTILFINGAIRHNHRSTELRHMSEMCEHEETILIQDASGRYVCARYMPCQ